MFIINWENSVFLISGYIFAMRNFNYRSHHINGSNNFISNQALDVSAFELCDFLQVLFIVLGNIPQILNLTIYLNHGDILFSFLRD